MVKILILLISLISFSLGKKKYGSIINPYCIFNIFWFLVDLLLIIGNEYVDEPSNTAWWIIFLGVTGFNLSGVSREIVLSTRYSKPFDHSYTLNSELVVLLSYVVLVFSIITASDAVIMFINGKSFAEIRTDYFDYGSSDRVIMYYIRNYISSPLRYVLIVASAIDFFSEFGKKNKSVLINTLLAVVLQAITSGGRFVLMNTFFVFICSYIYFGKSTKIQFKQKVYMIILCAVLCYAIVYFTNDRKTYLMESMTTGERLYTTIYQYFAGSVTYLGKVLKNSPEVVRSTYGINFIAGFLSPFFVTLNFLHIFPYPKIFSVIGEKACVQLLIGPHTYYNAFPTIFGYYYIDGGYVFVLIEAWLFGYLCRRIYERSMQGNLLFTSFYFMIFVQLCNVSTRWFFYSPDFCLSFIYMLCIFKISNSQTKEGLS